MGLIGDFMQETIEGIFKEGTRGTGEGKIILILSPLSTLVASIKTLVIEWLHPLSIVNIHIVKIKHSQGEGQMSMPVLGISKLVPILLMPKLKAMRRLLMFM